MTRSDVCSPIYITTEPNDHVFGGWRGKVREETTEECVQIEDKSNNKVNEVFKSYLKVTRKVGHGYDVSFDEFSITERGCLKCLRVLPTYNLNITTIQ